MSFNPFGPPPGAAPPMGLYPAPFQLTGTSVYNSPATADYTPARNPMYPSRSVERTFTANNRGIHHASFACSSNFANLAQRLSYLLESPSQGQMIEAIDLLQNCLSERRINSERFGGMNPEHQLPYNLVKNLLEFVSDYYQRIGNVGEGMVLQFLGQITQGFQVRVQRSAIIGGRYVDRFQITPNGIYPLQFGGKFRGRKATRRAGRKARKTRGKRK